MTTADQRLLDSRARADWKQKDAWRSAADPVRVRGGLRHAGRPAAGGQRVRLGPVQAGQPRVRAGRAARRRAGPGRLRGDHRRRAGRDGGGEQGRHRGRRPVGRAGHRAAVRAGHERVGRHRHRLPLLLRPQDHVRQVRPGVLRAAGRLRHAGRAVRGADPGADRQGDPVPGGAARHGVLAGPDRLDAPGPCAAEGKIGPTDLDLLCVTDDVDDAVRHIIRVRHAADPPTAPSEPRRPTVGVAAICVFCASSRRSTGRWLDLAREVGAALAAARAPPGLRRRPGRHDGHRRRGRPVRRRRTPSA